MKQVLKLRRLGDMRECERGAIAVELGVIMSVLTVLVIGLLEYAQAIHQHILLEQAARAGAEYALRFPTDTSGIQMAVAGAGTANADTLTVTSAQYCECPDGSSADCSNSCTDGSQPNEYVRVGVMQPAMDTLSQTGLLSGRILSASAALRLR